MDASSTKLIMTIFFLGERGDSSSEEYIFKECPTFPECFNTYPQHTGL